jgi:sRNA-binding protein
MSRAAHAERLRLLAILKATFPASIGALKPLKIGAARDLEAALPECPARDLRRALAVHTGRSAYLRALAAEGAMRVNLDGHEVEPVSAEHRAQAAATINTITEKRRAAKAA